MKTNPASACPRCGEPVSGGIKGLCPNCLALIGFGPENGDSETLPSEPGDAIERGAAGVAEPGRPMLAARMRYFGDYELIDEVARGGMGVVFRARQKSLNRIVAVKMIRAGDLASETDVQRFQTEAEAAANLQHPNIVAIHEVGMHEGQHYFSMDYVEGTNLSSAVKDGPMAPRRAAELTRTIAEAIQYAHLRGILHRDLKPHNVLLDERGEPRITDFGLAKRIGEDSELTASGAVLGSPAYMAPEQATGRGEQVGPASDVYSMGAILYELLTGRAPFRGETALATMRKVLEEEPIAPSKLNPQTPAELETVCLKCLEKRPERRYHSARELVEELGRFLRGEPILAKPASVWRKGWGWALRNPWALIGAGAAACVGVLGFAYYLWERVRYLEWASLPEGPARAAAAPQFGVLDDPAVAGIVGCWILIPAVLFGRWVNGLRRRNLPVGRHHLTLLAVAGVLLVAAGLWNDAVWIRLHVWEKLFGLMTAVAFCLGTPLVFCWAGGILVWQAARGQQARWAGSLSDEAEWLPRQATQYSTVRFAAAMCFNLVLFAALAHLFFVAARFAGAAHVTREGYVLGQTFFLVIALQSSTAGWLWVTRRIYRRPKVVSAFLAVLYGAGLLVPFSFLPAAFVLLPVAAGVLGTVVLVRWVRIGEAAPREPLPPLVLGELFDVDRRSLAVTAGVLAVALVSYAITLFPGDYGMILFFTGLNALWPGLILASRTAQGRTREVFVAMLVALAFCVIGVPAGGLAAGFKTGLVTLIAGTVPVGVVAGLALIYFGRVRAKRNA